MNEPFKALVARKESDNISLAVENMSIDDLSPGEVVVKVAYSSVNYKDGLACDPKSRVARSYPLIPGIDLTGTVMQSEDGRFRAGDEVLVTGYGLGVSHSGGFSELARVPADWIVPVPAGLTMRECMIIGTAGFTAALSVQKLQLNGLTPEQGPVLVTGATGGVGSMAVSILAKLGYSVTASTGKEAEHDYLKGLGASEVIGRDEWIDASDKPLLKEKMGRHRGSCRRPNIGERSEDDKVRRSRRIQRINRGNGTDGDSVSVYFAGSEFAGG